MHDFTVTIGLPSDLNLACDFLLSLSFTVHSNHIVSYCIFHALLTSGEIIRSCDLHSVREIFTAYMILFTYTMHASS